MDTIAVSKLKATCLERLERVRQTGRPLLVTKRGVPIARPAATCSAAILEVGSASWPATVTEVGDIVAPLDETDWEVLR